jgi:hypothetical protein
VLTRSRPPGQLPQGLLQRLALDVPQRHVDRRQGQGEDAGGAARIARGKAQLAHDRLDQQRVLAHGQRAEFIDRAAQRPGHRAAIERQADAFDARIGVHAEDDDRAQPAGFLRHVGQRIVFRNAQDGCLGAGDLHGASSAGCAGA